MMVIVGYFKWKVCLYMNSYYDLYNLINVLLLLFYVLFKMYFLMENIFIVEIKMFFSKLLFWYVLIMIRLEINFKI